MLVDLRVHTRRSPGSSLDAKEAISRAREMGLDGVCLTDLDTLDSAEDVRALGGEAGIAVFAGMVAQTDHGRFLCFFPDPTEVELGELLGEGPALERRAADFVDAVLEAGGAAIASAPYDRELERPMGDFILSLRGLTAVEGFVGTQRNNVNELAIQAAGHLAVPCVGGSGASGDYGEIGTAATIFRDEVRNEEELVAALRGGRIWAAAIGDPPRFHGDELASRQPSDEERGRGGPRRGGRRSGGRGRSGGKRGAGG